MNTRQARANTGNRIAFGMLIVIVSLFVFLSDVGALGGVGKMVSSFFIGFFGLADYAYSVIGIMVGIAIMFNAKLRLPISKILIFFGLFILGILALHVYSSSAHVINANYGAYLMSCYNLTNTAGGMLFGIVAFPLMKFITTVGALVVVCAAFFGLAFFSFMGFFKKNVTYSATTKSDRNKKVHGSVRAAQGKTIAQQKSPTITDFSKIEEGQKLFIVDVDGDPLQKKHKKSKGADGYNPLYPNAMVSIEDEERIVEKFNPPDKFSARGLAKDILFSSSLSDESFARFNAINNPNEALTKVGAPFSAVRRNELRNKLGIDQTESVVKETFLSKYNVVSTEKVDSDKINKNDNVNPSGVKNSGARFGGELNPTEMSVANNTNSLKKSTVENVDRNNTKVSADDFFSLKADQIRKFNEMYTQVKPEFETTAYSKAIDERNAIKADVVKKEVVKPTKIMSQRDIPYGDSINSTIEKAQGAVSNPNSTHLSGLQGAVARAISKEEQSSRISRQEIVSEGYEADKISQPVKDQRQLENGSNVTPSSFVSEAAPLNSQQFNSQQAREANSQQVREANSQQARETNAQQSREGNSQQSREGYSQQVREANGQNLPNRPNVASTPSEDKFAKIPRAFEDTSIDNDANKYPPASRTVERKTDYSATQKRYPTETVERKTDYSAKQIDQFAKIVDMQIDTVTNADEINGSSRTNAQDEKEKRAHYVAPPLTEFERTEELREQKMRSSEERGLQNSDKYPTEKANQYSTEKANQYPSNKTDQCPDLNNGQYSMQNADKYSAQNNGQYPQQKASQYTTEKSNQYTSQKAEQYTAQKAEQYTAQKAEQYSQQKANQYTVQKAEQYSTQKFEKSGNDNQRLTQTNIEQVISKAIPKRPYIAPPISLLTPADPFPSQNEDYEHKKRVLIETLISFDIVAEVTDIMVGPTFSLYTLKVEMPKGRTIGSIVNLENDIAMKMEEESVRILAPIPGKNAVGIEVPNKHRRIVRLRELLTSPTFNQSKSPATFALGKNLYGNDYICDIKSLPHMLIAGATGAGKSCCINSVIISLLYKASPEDVRLILIDPKRVELSVYAGIPHLLLDEIVCDVDKAIRALNWAITEMNRRIEYLSNLKFRDIDEHNQDCAKMGYEKMPRIVIIVDELADLMSLGKKAVEDSINRIARLARAVGIHLVLATQRPSVDVVSGTIKNNLPTRVAFKVTSGPDSRTVLDANGADKLLGNGDLLYMTPKNALPERMQGAFISNSEVNAVVDFIKANNSTYFDDSIKDAIFKDKVAESAENKDKSKKSTGLPPELFDALRIGLDGAPVSISNLQRKLGLGWPKAAKIYDMMDDLGYLQIDEKDPKRKKVNITEQELDNLIRENMTDDNE